MLERYFFSYNSPLRVMLDICCSVTKSCLPLCDPMDCSMPGFPVLHCLPEFAQTHVLWVGDAIQPSHPITHFSSCPPSFPASWSFPMSWLFASGGQSTGDYLLLTSPGENYILDICLSNLDLQILLTALFEQSLSWWFNMFTEYFARSDFVSISLCAHFLFFLFWLISGHGVDK